MRAGGGWVRGEARRRDYKHTVVSMAEGAPLDNAPSAASDSKIGAEVPNIGDGPGAGDLLPQTLPQGPLCPACKTQQQDPWEIYYVDYQDESMLSDIQTLVSKDLSEPYSVFLYRYFLHNWPTLCVCAYVRPRGEPEAQGKMIATIVCKAEEESDCFRGYIAMLAVDSAHRKKGIALELATRGIDRMVLMNCDEVVLEAEATNTGALALYERLGFVRDEKLERYYLNGGDAYRLKLWIDKRPEGGGGGEDEGEDGGDDGGVAGLEDALDDMSTATRGDKDAAAL